MHWGRKYNDIAKSAGFTQDWIHVDWVVINLWLSDIIITAKKKIGKFYL